MAKFFLKLFLLSLPIVFMLSVPAVMFVVAREYYSADDVVEAQSEDKDILYNPCCSNIKKEYKQKLVSSRASEVVIIGTSRVLTIKSIFFKNPERITNAGQILTSLDELTKVQSLIKNKTKLVIIGLDPQMFNPDFESRDIPSIPLMGNMLERLGSLLGTYWTKFYADLLSGRTSLSAVWKHRITHNIGLVSLETLSGFRSDGSFEYGPIITSYGYRAKTAETIRLSIESLKVDRSSYLYGGRINDRALYSLESFLAFCKENMIEVVGFLSPQPHQIYSEISGVSDIYSYNQTQLPKEIQKVFIKNGYTFANFSDGQTLGLQDDDFIDSVHAGETAYRKILLSLSQLSSTIKDRLFIKN